MFLPRDILPVLIDELKRKEITVITGMRQVGKTSLLQFLFGEIKSKNKAFFDFSLPTHRKLFDEMNYDGIWANIAPFGINNKEKAYIFIDEIQNFPPISQVAKYLYDHYNIKFVFTGSSSYYLKNLFPESMAGRKQIVEVFPLTFREFLTFKQTNLTRTEKASFMQKAQGKKITSHELFNPFYKEYIYYGGFPKVALEQDPKQKDNILNEIFSSYFDIDVKSLADIREREKMRDLILLLPARIGQIIDTAKIAQELEISWETVKNYLSFLNQTYFLYFIPRFSNNIDVTIRGKKKIYLADSGLARIIGKLSEGQLFEQSVFQNLHIEHKLMYYRTETGHEIDFIADEQTALEVKLNPGKMDLANLKKRAQSIGVNDYYAISRDFSDLSNVIMCTDL